MVGAVRFEPSSSRTDSPDKQSISAQPEQALTQLRTQSPGITCPELARVVAAWETLPAHIKKTILTLVVTQAG